MERPPEITLALPVRTYDINFARHVSNIVYIRWFRDLHLRMLEVYRPLEPQVTP